MRTLLAQMIRSIFFFTTRMILCVEHMTWTIREMIESETMSTSTISAAEKDFWAMSARWACWLSLNSYQVRETVRVIMTGSSNASNYELMDEFLWTIAFMLGYRLWTIGCSAWRRSATTTLAFEPLFLFFLMCISISLNTGIVIEKQFIFICWLQIVFLTIFFDEIY